MTTQKEIQREDLPAMYREASDSSARSQNIFIRWNVINLAVLVLAAIVSALKDPLHEYTTGLTLASAILLAIGAIITFALRKNPFEREWYRSRAIAESVKTLSWRFMTCASPYEHSLAEAEATLRFEKVLHDIAEQESKNPIADPGQVTDKMKQVRTRSVTDRKDLYIRERVKDQFGWYKKNSERNSQRGKRAMYVAVMTQVIAVIGAFVLFYLKQNFDLGGILAAMSASALAWIQLKRFEDLAEAYRTAAKELSRILDEAPTSSTEEALSQFVIDSENALSREHTLWLAKRS